MATAANDMPKRKRVRYSAEYRAEALALAEGIEISLSGRRLTKHRLDLAFPRETCPK